MHDVAEDLPECTSAIALAISGAISRSCSRCGTSARSTARTRSILCSMRAAHGSRSPAPPPNNSMPITAATFSAIGKQPARRMRRHRHVILLIGRGRYRIDARRRRTLTVLGDQRGRGDLRHHEPGIQPRPWRQERRRRDSAGSISMAMRRSAMAPISHNASAMTSAAKATGSPWKLPPDSASRRIAADQRIVRPRRSPSISSVEAAWRRISSAAPMTCGWQRRQ